jgi:predicted DNA-binding transcriptional regulator AlpA
MTNAEILRGRLGLVTEEELALALDVKVSTLETWRAQETGPCHTKLGKQVFYHVDDIDKWVQASKCPCSRYPA